MAKGKKKLPKRIAGIKVPKSLRKSGGSLAALLDSPHGREVAAAALSAAATALLGTDKVRKAAAGAEHAVADVGSAVARNLGTAGHAVGAAVQEVAKAVLPEALTESKANAPKKSRQSAADNAPSKH